MTTVDPIWRQAISSTATEELAKLLNEEPRRMDVREVVGVLGYGTNTFSALGLAILDKKMAHVKLLLDKGAPVNGRCYYGDAGSLWIFTPLSMAIYYDAPELVDLFLRYGANPLAATTTCSNIPMSALKMAQDTDKTSFTPRLEEVGRKLHMCRLAAISLLALKRFRHSAVSVFPRDIVVLIAKTVYDCRAIAVIHPPPQASQARHIDNTGQAE